jgi:hypothetical protein
MRIRLPIGFGIAGIASRFLERLRPEIGDAEPATKNIVTLHPDVWLSVRRQTAGNPYQRLNQEIERRVVFYLNEFFYFPAHGEYSGLVQVLRRHRYFRYDCKVAVVLRDSWEIFQRMGQALF